MISATSEHSCSIPPGSFFCSGCSIGDNCPNTDTGPEEPILEQYRGFYADTSTIGNFTLSEFASMALEQFMEIGYDDKIVMAYFSRLQEEIRTLICTEV